MLYYFCCVSSLYVVVAADNDTVSPEHGPDIHVAMTKTLVYGNPKLPHIIRSVMILLVISPRFSGSHHTDLTLVARTSETLTPGDISALPKY